MAHSTAPSTSQYWRTSSHTKDSTSAKNFWEFNSFIVCGLSLITAIKDIRFFWKVKLYFMSTPRAFQKASSASHSISCASMAASRHSSHIAFNSKTSSQLRLSNVVFIFLFVRRWAFPHSLETLNHGLRKKSTPKTTFFYFFLPTHLASLVPSTPFFQKKRHFIQ